MASKTPRTPKRYDPVLLSDIPPGTPVDVARKMIGKTDPAMKRRSRPPQVPPAYGRRSSSLPAIAPPQRTTAQSGQRAVADRPSMPQRRVHERPEPPTYQRRSGSVGVPPVGPSPRPARQHERPEPPKHDRRASRTSDLPPVGGTASSPRRTVGPDRPVMPRRSKTGGMDLMPPVQRSSGGESSSLSSIKPPMHPEMIDTGVTLEYFKSRGVTSVRTYDPFGRG